MNYRKVIRLTSDKDMYRILRRALEIFKEILPEHV